MKENANVELSKEIMDAYEQFSPKILDSWKILVGDRIAFSLVSALSDERILTAVCELSRAFFAAGYLEGKGIKIQ